MKKKAVRRDVVILLIAVIALVCAALNLHVSLNKLGNEED